MTGKPATKSIHHLVMMSPDEFRPKYINHAGFRVLQLTTPSPEFNWFMYQIIGPDYRWGGRNDWSKENWTAFVSKPSLETWLAYQDGNPVGYYEMELMKDRTIKIHCVGLIKKYIGLGLGAHLLSHCVDRGWQHNPTKITLNTCSHDHPRALPNYLKRGFRMEDNSIESENSTWESKIFK